MRITFLFLLVAFSLSSLSQKAEQAIDTFFKKFPQEKVILSLSKDDYLAGETIFFKANVLVGYEPSVLSSNLYVELYDAKKDIIARQLIYLYKGSGAGAFELPSSLAENVYYIRAYTQYMLNYREEFQCIKPVSVYNPASTYRLEPKPVQWTATAFPEGGTLVSGIPTTLVVRLFSAGTFPDRWEATLLDKKTNDTIAAVQILNNELGVARFLPSSDKEYIINISDNLGNKQQIDVAKVADTGVVFQAWVRDSVLEYTVQTKNIATKGEGYKIIGTIHGLRVFTSTVTKSAGAVKGKLNIADLPSGILQLQLFDNKDKPLNERLCFLHQDLKVVTPIVRTDTLSLVAKGLNHWQVEVDTLNWPSYLVQVSDAAHHSRNEFLGDVYLRSDFSEKLQNASWYFQNVDQQKKAVLDALLMTEKWQRFNWHDLVEGRFPDVRVVNEKYLTYTGSVYKGGKPQPLRELNLILKGKESPVQFIQITTDSAGRFEIDNLYIVDTATVFYRANDIKFLERDVKIEFELQNKFSENKANLPTPEYQLVLRKETDTLPARVKHMIAQRQSERLYKEKEKLMDEVVIRTKARNAREELEKQLVGPGFTSPDAKIFDFVNENNSSALGYSNILEWLQGRFPGYRLHQEKGNFYPLKRGTQIPVYLDEVPIDPSILNGFPASNIAMIKFFYPSILFGRLVEGSIAIYTKRGNMETPTRTASLPNSNLIGYQKQPAFFSPDYSVLVNAAADKRTILYRNAFPNPKEGSTNSVVKFFNNDSAKKVRLTITGFTNTGQLVFLDKVIN